MNQENYLKIYELLVQAMRYWFALLAIFIVYVSVLNIFRDYRTRKKLNEDETVGELRVLSGGGDTVVKNTIWEFTHEAMIGSARNCDVTVTHSSVLPQHVLMKVEGDHVLLRLIQGNAGLRINNHPYEYGTYDMAYSGDRLKVGDVVLELWLFGEEDILEDDYIEEKPKKTKKTQRTSEKKPSASSKKAGETIGRAARKKEEGVASIFKKISPAKKPSQKKTGGNKSKEE